MGGVLIKLGQFMSTRADLMPEEYLEELKKLQDEVTPVPLEAIHAQIEDQYGKPVKELFDSFDETPLASASLAQAHLATLHGGQQVVVKVQRPDVEELAYVDLATFAFVMGAVERYTGFGRRNDIKGIVSEFSKTLGEELDFYREAHNAERFGENFKNNDKVFVPKIYWEYVTDKVLVLEWIQGIKINDIEGLRRAGYDLGHLAVMVTEAYLEQVIEYGFFHADPHPGNLFVCPGPTLVFIDFGMVGEITPKASENLKALVVAVARKDPDEVISVLSRLGFTRKGVNLTAPRNALAFLFQEYHSITSADVTFDALEKIQEDLRVMVYEQPFTLPAQFAFLARAIGTMIGVANTLDPDFDVTEAAKPQLNKLIDEAKDDWAEIVIDQAKSIGTSLIRMPKQLESLLDRMDRGDLRVRIDAASLSNAVGKSSKGYKQQASAIWGVGSLVGGIVLLLADYQNLAIGLGVLSAWMLLRSVTSGRRSFPL